MTETPEMLALRMAGLSPSQPRIRILEYLRSGVNHPTADQILAAMQQQTPQLSRMTIYNTLRLFVENGLCRDVRIEENQVRYDCIIRNHGHFKCNGCGELFDFDMPAAAYDTDTLSGFVIEQRDIFCWGCCPDCHDKAALTQEPVTRLSETV